MLHRVVVAMVSLALSVTACSDDDGTDTAAVTSIPDPRSTTTSSTTTEVRAVAPDVIPDDEAQITEEYVEAVLAALSRASLDAFLATRKAGVADERTMDILSATNTPENAVDRINALADVAAEGFDRYHADPEPVEYRVHELVTARTDCIVASVEVDPSAYIMDPPAEPPPGETMVELLPATAEQRASGLNPTAWVIASIPVVTPSDDPPDCAS